MIYRQRPRQNTLNLDFARISAQKFPRGKYRKLAVEYLIGVMKAKILCFLLGVIFGSGLIAAFHIRETIHSNEISAIYPNQGLLYVNRVTSVDGDYYSMSFGSGFLFGDRAVLKRGDFSGSTGTVRGIVLNTTTSLVYQVEIGQGRLVDVSAYDLGAVPERR